MTERQPWVEPGSYAEAQDRRNEAISRAMEIQAQLGSEDADPEWRQRAKYALAKTHDEIRRLKQWSHDHPDLDPRMKGQRDPGVLSGMVTARVKKLMDVFCKAQDLIEDDTDEHFDALVESVRAAEKVISSDV